MHDLEAVRRLKRGEIDGLEVLVARHQLRGGRTAYLVTQDAALAEDVVQETFLRIFQRIRSFDETRLFEPYLMRSVVNASLDAVRKLKRETHFDGDSDEVERLMSRAVSVEAQAESDQLQEQVLAAIGKLPPRQRAVIAQRYYLEMSEAEMAQELDAPPGTVKWLLNAARTRLRVLLKSERSAE
jgi:RNA polymerase sigma-70 factor, ECF subfamily